MHVPYSGCSMGHKHQLPSGLPAKGALPADARHVYQGSNPGKKVSQRALCSHIFSCAQDKQELRNLYECPVYKTRERGNGVHAWIIFTDFHNSRPDLHLDIQPEDKRETF